MIVFDSDGEKIGIVTRVMFKENKNQIESLVIQASALRKEVIIPSELIKSIGDNVFLITEKNNLKFN